MRQRDTISLLIHRGWPGSACDKTQVINILWIGGDLASLLHLFFCSLLIFGAVFCLLQQVQDAQNDNGGRRLRGIVWRLEAQRSCVVQSQNLDLPSWQLQGILVPGGGWGVFEILYSSFFVLSWFHILLLYSLQGHGAPLNSFKPTCFSTILVQVVKKKNQSINLHACFRTSGLA